MLIPNLLSIATNKTKWFIHWAMPSNMDDQATYLYLLFVAKQTDEKYWTDYEDRLKSLVIKLEDYRKEMQHNRQEDEEYREYLEARAEDRLD